MLAAGDTTLNESYESLLVSTLQSWRRGKQTFTYNTRCKLLSGIREIIGHQKEHPLRMGGEGLPEVTFQLRGKG